MAASGNMTGPNIDTYYSSVISLRSMRTVVFLSEPNKIETRNGKISNVYLNAGTTEKIVFNAGTDFAPFGHAGHLLLIKTTLYGLKSYGARFHSQLSYALPALGFVPSMGVCDIWMLNEGDYKSYVACYRDNLLIVHKDPYHVFESIIGKGFTIIEKSAPDYFLGGYFEHVKEPKTDKKILKWVSKIYVKQMMDNFNNTFGFEPSKKNSATPPDYKT